MAARGARHLLLFGRRPPSPDAQQAIDALQETGVHVVVEQGDVADEACLAEVLADARRTLPPLRGVVHAAGTLDDGLLLTLDIDRFRAVMASGARRLESPRRDPNDPRPVRDLSSAAAILGSPGQEATPPRTHSWMRSRTTAALSACPP
jgi:NAD(P)-dependent dehydrogenase (short-subunit alcohol dehydrogenase family)